MKYSLYMCSVCRKEFPFEDIKYSANGKKIICADCYKSSGHEKEKVEKENRLVKSDNRFQEDNEDAVKVFCRDCRYKFSLKKKSEGNINCPYCGGINLMKDRFDVNEILREVSQHSGND